MPSIEVVCVGEKSATQFGKLSFVILGENRLKSHRIPSHFQKDFNRLHGCIYHFGCPHLKKRGIVEAYDLLARKCQSQERTVFLQFKQKFVPEVSRVLRILAQNSVDSRIIFTSDWQFSSNKPKRIRGITLPEFWRLHNNQQLRFNTLYEIIGTPAPALH